MAAPQQAKTPTISINSEDLSIKTPVLSQGPRWLNARYVLAFLSFLGFVNVYLLRVNLSVALVAMVRPKPQNSSNSVECPVENSTSSQNSTPTGEVYDWDRELQGTILGSFFYGYIITQIPGGWLAGVYGGKKLLGFGILCTTVFTLLTPLAAQWSVYVLIATRILEGIGEGVTFPAMHAMWGVWAPPMERSKLVTFASAGSQFGTVIGLPLSGIITEKLGWQYVFYIFGALAAIWFVLWMLLVSDSPADHPRISREELHYIESSVNGMHKKPSVSFRDTPWLAMVKSPAVWAVSIGHFSHNWGFYTLLTCLPTYLKDVLHFDISTDSGLAGLPYLFMWLTISFGGIAADALRQRGILSTVAVRKLFLAVGLLVPAACLIGVGYIGCNYVAAVVLLCLAGAFDGISLSGYQVNHLDIAPAYAGTLMGITNCLATIPGFLGPQVVGWLTSSQSTSIQWRYVFMISAGIYVFGVVIFTIFGSGVEQSWARREESQLDSSTTVLADDDGCENGNYKDEIDNSLKV